MLLSSHVNSQYTFIDAATTWFLSQAMLLMLRCGASVAAVDWSTIGCLMDSDGMSPTSAPPSAIRAVCDSEGGGGWRVVVGFADGMGSLIHLDASVRAPTCA